MSRNQHTNLLVSVFALVLALVFPLLVLLAELGFWGLKQVNQFYFFVESRKFELLCYTAMLIGIIPIIKYSMQRDKKRIWSVRLAVAAIMLCMGSLYFILSTRFGMHEAWRMQTKSNLRIIGKALLLYAEDNNGWTPSIEPEAKKIANKNGVPAGCVLAYKNNGCWKTSGLGRIVCCGQLKKVAKASGTYPTMHLSAFFCDLTLKGSDAKYFRVDAKEEFWKSYRLSATNNNEVGELPGNPDYMISSIVLRYNTNNEFGAMQLKQTRPEPILSTLLVFGKSWDIRHFASVYTIFFTDGSVKRYTDKNAVISNILRYTQYPDLEKVLDKVIFEKYFANTGN